MNYKESSIEILEKINNPMYLRAIYVFLETLTKDNEKAYWYTLEYAAEGKEFFGRFHKKMETKMLWFTDCKAIEYDGFGSFSKILEKHRTVQISTHSGQRWKYFHVFWN